MIFSKRRTGNEKDEKLRVKEKKTEMVARGRIMHVSKHAQGKEQEPHVSRSLICPLLFYMRRSVALRGTALDSRACLCYFPRSLASKFFFLYLSTISFSFEKETRKNYMGNWIILMKKELLKIVAFECVRDNVNLLINIIFME